MFVPTYRSCSVVKSSVCGMHVCCSRHTVYCESCCKMSLIDCVDISVLYATSITIALAPGDVTSYVEFLKNLNLSSSMIWFPVKTICAFPLVYHYINGIRHLVSMSPANTGAFNIICCNKF